MPLDEFERRWRSTLRTVERFGRNPDDLQLVVRADPQIDSHPAGRHRTAFSGSCAQVVQDIEQVVQDIERVR